MLIFRVGKIYIFVLCDFLNFRNKHKLRPNYKESVINHIVC